MSTMVSSGIVRAFSRSSISENGNGFFDTEVLSGGLINHTYRITPVNQPAFLLQQINRNVFPQPGEVQDNYIRIWKFASGHIQGFRLPTPLFTENDQAIFIDEDENCWRAFEYIHNTRSFQIAETPVQAAATAGTFAGFTASFGGFDATQLKPVIPGFHDLSLRYRQFEAALETGNPARLMKAASIIDALKSRERYLHFYESIIHSGEYRLRVMHHDAKIANILFSTENGQVVCPVDYDTVMPGYFFSDLGDMIRTMASCKDENSTDLETLCIRRDFYLSVLHGYMAVMEDQFTATEKKNIHYAGILMIYMQALRFLTDYLNDDTYYRITHPEHNFERALNQLTLLNKLETFLQEEFSFRA